MLKNRMVSGIITSCLLLTPTNTVSASTNVDYFDEDGYEFARIYCGYSVLDNKKSVLEGRVYLLRRDAEKHWRIYGWANANDVNPQ